jgi:hypothetical protein
MSFLHPGKVDYDHYIIQLLKNLDNRKIPLHHHKTLLEPGEGTQTKLSNSFEVLDFDLTKPTQQLQSTTTKQNKEKTNCKCTDEPISPLLPFYSTVCNLQKIRKPIQSSSNTSGFSLREHPNFRYKYGISERKRASAPTTRKPEKQIRLKLSPSAL